MLMDEDTPSTTPEWTVTFGDLMALLLTFFVLMVSMSEFKKTTKFQNIADSLEHRFGGRSAERIHSRDARIADPVAAARERRQALLQSHRSFDTVNR